MFSFSIPDVTAAIDRQTAAIQNLTKTLKEFDMHLAEKIEALKAEVTKTKEVHASAVALLKGLHDALVEHADDPAAIQEIIDGLKADTEGLAAAIVANTPAEPTA
jgi:hypothetical protein